MFRESELGKSRRDREESGVIGTDKPFGEELSRSLGNPRIKQSKGGEQTPSNVEKVPVLG